MGITILPQTFTGKFDEMNQQLVKIANAQSTASGGIADAVNLANQATQSAEAKIVDVESRFNTLTSAQQGDSEVVDARKGEVSLRAKIDKIDTAHIAHLADNASHNNNGQLKFPATQNPSSDANTLDDYEEGTWTGSLVCSTSGTITLLNDYKTGTYTKVGRKVTVTGVFAIESVDSPVGDLFLSGLPFACASGTQNRVAVAVVSMDLANSLEKPIVGMLVGSQSLIQIYKIVSGNIAELTGDMKAGTNFYINATYNA